MNRPLSLALVGALVIGGSAGLAGVAAPAAEAASTVSIDVLSINDFHGRLEAGGVVAGAAVLAGAVDHYTAANPNTLLVSAGDNIGASTFTSFIQQDKPTIDALNQMKLAASALGNHEFDRGRSDVDSRVIPSAAFPYLAANLYDTTTGKPAYDQYSISVVDGVRIGFVGAVTEQLPSLVGSSALAGLQVKPIVPEVNRVADQLTDGDPANGEADVVVLLVHEGAATPALADSTDDSAFGSIVTGVDTNVDAIVSGHTHQVYDHDLPVAGWPTGRTRPVLQAGEYGENIGHLALSVDSATHELQSITSEIVPLTNPDTSPRFAPDAAVAAIVSDAVAVAAVKGNEKVGSITADFNKAKQTGGTEDNRGGESTLGNFVADVQLASTQAAGSQIAFMNPGGLRTDLTYASSGPGDGDGSVSYRELANVQPFANTLVTLDVTGDQIRRILEQQWQPTGASRPFLKLGVSHGFSYSYDPTRPSGSRIGQMSLNGHVISPIETVIVTANKFLADGGDNFTTFAEGTGRADSGKVDLDSMIDYFHAHPVVSPDYAQRAIGVHLSAPDANGYSAGDTINVSLSSLLFSGGEPPASRVELAYDGTTVGTAAIDPTVVDTTDEVGRATVIATIPGDGDAGDHVLTARVAESKTSIDVPLHISALPPLKQSALNDANSTVFATVSATPNRAPTGSLVRLSISGHEGRTVSVVGYQPQLKVATAVVAGGGANIRIPAGYAPGEHPFAVYAGDGSLIGWVEITVAAGGRF
ncbi:MAG: multifunctional nuclease/2,3-cyclic-nucleotide [Subtercola sp.]|nr:multifunctional nuclease/2,3-cyclic-nucleotide [Subtercola sp.]